MGFKLTPRNILAVAAAPFSAGTSLLLAKDEDGSGIIDHVTGAASAKKANEQNMALQRETNQMSIDLANTAHQREVTDLEAAGLNPILSAGGSGAATPTLGTAQVQNTLPGGLMGQATQAAGILGTVATAQNAMSASKLADAQANNAIAENPYIPDTKKATIANLNANTALQDAQTINTDMDSISQDIANELNTKSGTSKESWGPERAMQNVIERIFGKNVSTAGNMQNSAKKTYNLHGRKYTYQ